MTRAEFLRICAGVAVAPLVAANDLRASTRLVAWSAHPGGDGGNGGGEGGGGSEGSDGGHDGGCGDGTDGSSWFGVHREASHPGGGCEGGGDDGGGGSHETCDEDHPSPENATAILGVLGAAAAFWPQVKDRVRDKMRSFRED